MKLTKSIAVRLASALAVAAAVALADALAADAGVARLMPRGGQRGTEVELKVAGRNLADAKEVVLYGPGLTIKELKDVKADSLTVRLAIAPDARLGEHSLRVRTETGLSDLRTFWVGAMPIVEEAEPNTEFATPQKLAGVNVTVHGVVKNEDVDYYLVQAKKGERITAEVEGLRLADDFFDPYLAILDENRFELAASDDTALLLQDPIVSCVAPKDGTYVIQLRESAYGGGENAHYRLHVGTFPRPRAIYPAGGKAGDDVNVQFLGDVAGPISQSLRLPAEPNPKLGLFAEQNGQTSPSPCYFRVSTFGNQLETEPNNGVAIATAYAGELPVAFNGVIAADGDVDWFRFKAKKGQVFDVNVFARRLRSSLDPVMAIGNKDGNVMASNDDAGNPDSYLRWTAPEDGEYTLMVKDHLDRGAVDAVYRVEVATVQPKLALSIPPVDLLGNSQERLAVVVPRGNRFATMMRVKRDDFGGEVALSAAQLPPGVTMHADPIAPNVDAVPVVFEAAADAPVGGGLADVTGKALDPAAKGLTGSYLQSIVMVENGNQPSYYNVEVPRLAVAVAAEANYTIRLEAPKIPLVQGGQMNLKVVVERKKDFDQPVKCRLLFNPPGVGSGEVEIPKGQTEAVIAVNANADAPVKKWRTCVLSSVDFPEGRQWVSTALTEIEVAPAILGGSIDLAATEQGKPAQVLVRLETKTKFDGEATLKLVGLPNGATAPDLKIKADAKEAVFAVTTDAKLTPAGQHKTLFCQVTLPKNGDQIVQGFANGGTLRVDAPPPPKPGEAPKPAETAKKPGDDKKPEKILTRLEKLRLEQQGKAGGK